MDLSRKKIDWSLLGSVFQEKIQCMNYPKFPISHGNADTEQAFSSSDKTHTSDRTSMSERTFECFNNCLKCYEKLWLQTITFSHINEFLSMGCLALYN